MQSLASLCSREFDCADDSLHTERRVHQRLDLELPLEFQLSTGMAEYCYSRTINISTGGLCFDHDRSNLAVGDTIDITLTVPASEGVWPYDARAHSTARILWTMRVPDRLHHGPALQRVAAQFTDKLRFQF